MSENVSVENIVRNALAESKRIETEMRRKEEDAKRATETAAKPNENVVEEETFKCPECGATLRGNQRYCNECGSEMEWEE